MTPEQKKLARHALGFDEKVPQSYRNRYYANEGNREVKEWEAMVAAGWATVGVVGKSHRYELTRAGAVLALETGETLCPEDFPI